MDRNLIKLTHANTSEELFVLKNKIFVVYESKAFNSTVICSGEGGVFPVKENLDSVLTQLKEDSNVESK